MPSLPRVVIIGRPNVGKSTLFNRILKKRIAIIEPTKGVTRDRIYQKADWDGINFTLIDTGGMITSTDVDSLFRKIREQSLRAIKEADVVILLTDVKEGLHPLDEEIAEILRKENKEAIVAVNKVDNEKLKSNITEFQKLGIKDVVAISALHGKGIDLLLDKVKKNLVSVEDQAREKNYVKIAIIGRPNVGKSSFLNALLKEERVVVDESPGTTRDAIDTDFFFNDKKFILIDTAGIRCKRKIKNAIDYFSSLRTKQAIEKADVVLFMIDGWEGIKRDDLYYIYEIWERGKGLVLAINKVDLIQRPIPEYEKLIKTRLALSEYLPIVYISARKGYNLEEAIWICWSVYENMGQRIKTSDLNKLMQEIKTLQPRITKGKKTLKIFYATQSKTYPPEIFVFVNYPELVSNNFGKFIERRIRAKFGFNGAPIRFVFKGKDKL